MRRLFDLGCIVELVHTVEAALQALTEAPLPDAILVDHLGVEQTTAALHALHSISAAIRTAVLLNPTEREDLADLRAAGADAHLIKPVRTASLIKVVEALAEGQSLGDRPAPESRQPSPSPSGPSLAALPSPAPQGLSILLADDNEINILLGRTLIAALGHQIDVAQNGQEAVLMAEARLRNGWGYDVILMDLHMPVMDGFAAVEAIRAAEAGTGRRATILALSADNTEPTRRFATAAGVDATLAKPIDSAQLSATFARIAAGELTGDAGPGRAVFSRRSQFS